MDIFSFRINYSLVVVEREVEKVEQQKLLISAPKARVILYVCVCLYVHSYERAFSKATRKNRRKRKWKMEITVSL